MNKDELPRRIDPMPSGTDSPLGAVLIIVLVLLLFVGWLLK